ncbi:hypothetical protein HPP92_019742 [Vanilla planifolia]|uniref:Ig-like domain-containing protein n=1 Tax=Vanilla planifolia TaxID=51239 RepID=A0A835UL83_VANPL|nr:hypothetical protein HPP92_019742 [Vanilla planifolia]
MSADHYVVESWMVAWAFQSDCQENLLSSILSTEPSWLEMRNLGMGFWFTDASQLRPRMEKLARAQYLKRKNPKDCALLYLALNRLQVLVGLFKISKDEKDKVLFGFLSRNFQEEKNKAAALKNAYVLMGRRELELAVAFFLLGGDHFSAVTVCAKNLGDEQLAIVICRLLEGFGGSLERQLISNILLPNAIEKGDYWMCSLFEWTLGNYSLSVKRLFELSMFSTIDDTATCSSIPFEDPHICPYVMIIASKQSLKNEIGEFMASVLSKFAAMMNTYSLGRFGLPLEALDCFAAASTLQSSDEERSFDIENHTIFGKFMNLFNATSVAPQTWLRGDFIYYLETNIKLRLAMQYISSLLQELPIWASKTPETLEQFLSPYNSLRDQEEHQIEEFRKNLKVVLLTFERRYSLKLIDIANMVLVFACQSGLLFLGYHLLHGIICPRHDVHSQHIAGHCILCPALICLLLKATREVFCMYSRYAVCCHLTDSALKLLFGRSSTVEDSGDWFLPRDLCLRSLIYSLRIIRQLLKFYDHLLLAERLSLRTYSLLEFMEYAICFSHMLFGRNLTELVRMVWQIYTISFSNHTSMEVMLADLMKLLHQGLEINSGDAANGCAEVIQVCSNEAKAKQVACSALLIPTDERWKLIETSLWMLVDSFANQQLSKFLPGKDLETENSMTPQKQLPTVVAKLAMASVVYVSSSLTKLLACFLIGKASKDLPVATLDWLEESDQCESGSLQCHIDKGACLTPMSSNSIEDNEALLQKLWEISVKPKDIYHCFLNERVYAFTYHSKKAPSSWKDISSFNLGEHESGASYHTSKGNFRITAPNVIDSLFVKREADADTTTLVTRRRDSNPKFENPAFANLKDIVKRNGELLEAICCNSINEQQLAVASNRKGLLFYNWKMEPNFKEKALHIWSEVAWPLNGWAGSASKPVAAHVSSGDGIGSKSGERLGLRGATRGSGSMARPGRDLTGGGAFGIPGYAGMGASGLGWVEQFEFEEFVDAPATAENVRSRALCSHPSRPFLLAGTDNTRIYLWEFGMDRATATYSVLPAANVPTHYKLSSLSAMEFDQSGHRFATAALDGMVCTWQVDVGGKGDVHSTESAHLFNNHASDVTYVAASGSILATAGFNSNGANILVWDTLAPPAASQASLVCHEGGARSLSVFDNGLGTGSISPLIITGGKNGDLGLHDFRYIANGRGKQYRCPSDLDIRSSNGYDDPKTIENAKGMIWYIPKAHLGSITKIATIPCSTMFLTGSKDGDVKLWDAKNAKLVFHWKKIHERHTFLQPNSRNIGAVVRAAVTDIQVFSNGFLTCGGDGSVKLPKVWFAGDLRRCHVEEKWCCCLSRNQEFLLVKQELQLQFSARIRRRREGKEKLEQRYCWRKKEVGEERFRAAAVVRRALMSDKCT